MILVRLVLVVLICTDICHLAQDYKPTCTTVAFSYSPMRVPDHGAAAVVCHASIPLHCLF